MARKLTYMVLIGFELPTIALRRTQPRVPAKLEKTNYRRPACLLSTAPWIHEDNAGFLEIVDVACDDN